MSTCLTVLNCQACVEIKENEHKTMCLVLSFTKIIVLTTTRNYYMFLSIPSNVQVLILYIHVQMHCYVLLFT